MLVTVLASSILTRRAARGIEPPPVQGERLAETVFVPVEVAEDVEVVRLASRLAMAKGGNVIVGAMAAASGEQLSSARERAREAEHAASAVGAEASSIVRVDTSAASALAAIAAEHEVSLFVMGWRKAALAADLVLGGQRADLLALADVPLLAVLGAGGDYRRVVLALHEDDLARDRAGERDLAIAVASVAASAVRGNAVLIAPENEAAREIAALVADGAEVVVDRRPRREAVAALLQEQDLVLLPSRPGTSPLHRDAVAIAELGIECSVAVPARPHAAAALVTGTPTLVGSRRPG